jgi:formylglycine-generating enzyme required for sulfatase activity
MTTLKKLLSKVHENLHTLQEKEAMLGGGVNAPLDLHNQISHHQEAIELIQQALSSQLTEIALDDLKTALKPLILLNDTYRVYLDELKPEIPPLPFEPETILIPAGPFLMGRQPGKDVPDHETPQHEVDLPAYRIGKYPVTNAQYAKFVEQDPERRPERQAGWHYIKPPQEKLKHPIVGISWDDALAYCYWLSQVSGRKYRLPTEAEWEKAARGDQDGRIYPWGDEFAPDHINYHHTQTSPVDQYQAGQSPYGCYDMAGNVREWTSTCWGKDWRKPTFTYPYQHDQREALAITATTYRIYRGGAYDDDLGQLGCSARGYYASNARKKNLGFRVVRED